MASSESFDDAQDVIDMMAAVHEDTYKVDMVRDSVPKHGMTRLEDIIQVLRAIGTDTYRVDALKHVLSPAAVVSGQALACVVQALDEDTYRKDAIECILKRCSDDKKKPVPTTNDFSGNEFAKIVASIREDTYRIDACKALMAHGFAPDSLAQGTKLLQEDTYKSDFVKLWKRYGCKTRSSSAAKPKDKVCHSWSDDKVPAPAADAKSSPPSVVLSTPVITIAADAKDVKMPDDESKGECAICTEFRAQAINLPCCHMCMCFACARKAPPKCIICQGTVSEIKAVFVAS